MAALLSLESLRVVLLFFHLICCAFAITYVIQADLKIARTTFSRRWLSNVASIISRWLVALWITGLAIVWVDTGFDVAALSDKPKLLLKLVCVMALTINGMFLHYLSFPVLVRHGPVSVRNSLLLAITGALSTSHWMAAAFIGIAKPLGKFSIDTLLTAYVAFFGAVVVIAIGSTPVVRHLLTTWRLRDSLAQLQGSAA